MAKPPSKRRGITLGARAESAKLDLLTPQTASSLNPESDQAHSAAGGDRGASREILGEQLAELCRVNDDLSTHWRRQAEQLENQSQQLERQRDQLALQTQQLDALRQSRKASRRLGVLLSLLVLSGTAAIGFHAWPRLQHVAGGLNRAITGAGEIVPQLQAVRSELTSLDSDMSQVGNVVASLREDVSGVHSEVGSLRKTVDTWTVNKRTVQTSAGHTRSAANASPRSAAAQTNRYWSTRPRMPW